MSRASPLSVARRLPAAARAVLVLAAAAIWTALSAPPDLVALLGNTLLRACLLAQLAAWPAALGALARAAPSLRRPHAAALAVIFAVALALRFATAGQPWHAFNWLECLSERVLTEPGPGWYGNGFSLFVRIPLALGLDYENAVFDANRVAGALGCVAVFVAEAALSRDARAGLAAAALLAVLPIHVLLSASETMQAITALFCALGVAGFAIHARTGDRAALVAGAAATLYAALTRPEGILLAPLLFLAYLPVECRPRLRDPLLATLVLGASAAGIPLFLVGVREKLAAHGGLPVVGFDRAVDNFVDGVASVGASMGWLVLAALAGFALRARSRGPALWLPLGLLALHVQVGGFDRNFANRWQLEIVPSLALAMGAAAIPALLGACLARRRDTARADALVAAAAVLLAAPATLDARVMHLEFDQQAEHRFLLEQQATLAALAPSPLVRPTPEAEGPLAVFPSYRLAGRPMLSPASFLAAGGPLPAVWFRGLACYRVDHAIKLGSWRMHPSCTAIEQRFVLEPIATRRIEAPSFVGADRPGSAPPVIGLFRVVAAR